ncbi:hypothetical protein [Pseudonocardia sp. ICBG162]|uniref:hypothetical protein n=1 Tax=Pseudonocardia sp. ICBG162 TaxID=2846761 RepID=UPI001CF68E8B|nr:hypothetical protein [Pseudonocardia sp. ICBG162]
MSDPTYRLLRELAGRVDDDLLATGRELVAVGEEGHALELLVAELVAGRAVLPHAVRSELVAEAAARRVQPDADACLPPAADVAAGPHRFDGDGPPGAAEAVAAALAGVPVPESGWTLAWRTTPAGAAPGPLPQPVLLARTGPHGAPEVLTYQAQSALARAGLVVSVEVGDDGPDPGYHRAARQVARPLPAAPVSDAAAAPAREDVSASLPGDAPRPTPDSSRSPLVDPRDSDGAAEVDTSGPRSHRVPDDRPSDRVGVLSSAIPPTPRPGRDGSPAAPGPDAVEDAPGGHRTDSSPGDFSIGSSVDTDIPASDPPPAPVRVDRPAPLTGRPATETPEPEDRPGRADPESTTEMSAAAAPSPGAAGPDARPDRAPDAATSGTGPDPAPEAGPPHTGADPIPGPDGVRVGRRTASDADRPHSGVRPAPDQETSPSGEGPDPAAEASSSGTGHAPGVDTTGTGSPASASEPTGSAPETGISDEAAPGPRTGTADPATPTPETGTPDRATPGPGTGTPDRTTPAPGAGTSDPTTRGPGTAASDPATSGPGTDTSDGAAPVPGTGTPDGAGPGPAGSRGPAARRVAAPAEGEDTAHPAPRPSPPIRALREASAGDWFDSPPEGDSPDPTPPNGVGEVPRHRFVADSGPAGNGHHPDANGAHPTPAGRGPVAGRPVGPAAPPSGRPSAPSDGPPPPPVAPAPPGIPAHPAASSPPAAAVSPAASVPPVVPADPAPTGPRAAPRDLGVPLRRRAGEGRAPAGGGPGPVVGRPPVGPPAAPGPDEASWLADWASGAWAGEIPPPETAARTDRSDVEETAPGTPHVVPAATATVTVDDDRRDGPAHPAHHVPTGDDPARPTSGPAHPGPGADRTHVGTSPAGTGADGAAPAPEDAPAHAGPAPHARAGLHRPAATGPAGTGTTGFPPPADGADPADEVPTPSPGVPILRAPAPPAPADGERRPRHLLLTDDEPDEWDATERDSTERDSTEWDGTVEDPTEPADVVAPATEHPAPSAEHPAPGPAEDPTTGPADDPAPRPRPRPRPAGGLADRLTPTEQDLLQRLHEELAARENGGEPTPRNGTARTDRG